MKEIDERLESLRKIRDEKNALDKEGKDIQRVLMEEWEREEFGKSHSYRVDDSMVTVTKVRQTEIVIDERGLKKALGAQQFNKLTTKRFDRDKLEKAMVEGTVDPVTVAAYIREEPKSNPFFRFSVKRR